MLNGVDVSDVPFTVKRGENIDGVVFTLTDRPAEISGSVLKASGEPASEYVLLIFSADSRFWVARTRRTQQVRPEPSGRFLVRDLPAGDYLISVVTDIEDGQWNDPAFLAALAASSPVKRRRQESSGHSDRRPLARWPEARQSRSTAGSHLCLSLREDPQHAVDRQVEQQVGGKRDHE
jgi:hypothetical protein